MSFHPSRFDYLTDSQLKSICEHRSFKLDISLVPTIHKWKQPPKELHLGIDPSDGAPLASSSWGYCLVGREGDVDIVVACGDYGGRITWNMQSRAIHELFFSLFNNLRRNPCYRDTKIHVHVDSSFGIVTTSLYHEIFTNASFPNVEVSVPFRASTKIDTAVIRGAIRNKHLCFAEDCGFLNTNALIGQTYSLQSKKCDEMIAALRVALHFTQNKVVPVEEIPSKIEFDLSDGKSLRSVITSRQLIYAAGSCRMNQLAPPILSRFHSTDAEKNIICPVSPAFAEANPDILMPQPESDKLNGSGGAMAYLNRLAEQKCNQLTSRDDDIALNENGIRSVKIETENKQEPEQKNDTSPFPLVFEEAPPVTSILVSEEADKIKGKLSDHALVRNLMTRGPIRFQTLAEVHCGQCGVLSSHTICDKCFSGKCVTLNQIPLLDNAVKPEEADKYDVPQRCVQCSAYSSLPVCFTCRGGMP